MPPDDTKQFRELTERIYDAALKPSLWPRVLDKLVARGVHASIRAED